MISRVRKRMILVLSGAGDVLPGDFVRCIGRRGVGLIESITNDTALVSDLSSPGHKHLLPCKWLVRAE